MGKYTKSHREHAGAKNSSASSGFHGKRAVAKEFSKKSRRVADKKAVEQRD